MNHMNRLTIVLALMLAASAAWAENYFTIGGNDTLRIAAGSDTVTVPVSAHFDGRVSRWNLTLIWPDGMAGVAATEGPGMTVEYLNSQGQECSYQTTVTYNTDFTVFTAFVLVTGYWPYGGGYIAYGPATWEAGDCDEMFYLTFKVENGFTGGTLTIDGLLSGDDPRGGGVGTGVLFYRPVTIVVTRPEGDINYDGEVTIADVTSLIRKVLNGTGTAGDDVNGDGMITIADVTALITLVLRTTNSAN